MRIDSASYWPESLTLILSVAEGWVALGDMAEAKPFLDEARSTILDKSNYHIVRNRTGSYVNAAGANFQALTKLICTYVMTVAQGPLDEALLPNRGIDSRDWQAPQYSHDRAIFFAILQLRIVDWRWCVLCATIWQSAIRPADGSTTMSTWYVAEFMVT